MIILTQYVIEAGVLGRFRKDFATYLNKQYAELHAATCFLIYHSCKDKAFLQWQFSNGNIWFSLNSGLLLNFSDIKLSFNGLMHWSNFLNHHTMYESRASEWGGKEGCNGRWCWLRVDILCPFFSMGFLAPRNLLHNLVLYVHIVVLVFDDGKDLFLPNATNSNLTNFEQKLSTSSSLSDQSVPENKSGKCGRHIY